MGGIILYKSYCKTYFIGGDFSCATVEMNYMFGSDF